MGLFGPSLGDIKNIDNQRHAYGWCIRCFGVGSEVTVGDNLSINKPHKKCSNCSGKGKLWIGPIPDGELSSIYQDSGHFVSRRIYPFQKKTPKDNYSKAPIERSASGSHSNCSHSWSFSHKGADKSYPRGHYKCTRCGASGVEENFGDGRIRAL